MHDLSDIGFPLQNPRLPNMADLAHLAGKNFQIGMSWGEESDAHSSLFAFSRMKNIRVKITLGRVKNNRGF